MAGESRAFFAWFAATTLIVVGAAWAWALLAPMKYFDAEYPMWAAKQAFVRDCKVGETVIVGDSRPMAGLIPARLGDGAVNLALGGASPIEVAYLVDDILRCPTPPRRIIMSFAAEHFLYTDTYWTRSVQFGFLNLARTEEVRAMSARLGDGRLYATSRWGSLADGMKNRAYAAKFPPLYFGAMVGGRLFLREAGNLEIYARVTTARGHHFFGTAEAASYVNDSDAGITYFQPSPLFDHYLARATAALQARGIPLYYVGMPVNETTFRAMRPEVRAQIAAYLQGHAARFANFRLVGDPVPFLPDDHFGDSEHLNLRGATRWSDYVAAQVKAMLAKGVMRAHSAAARAGER